MKIAIVTDSSAYLSPETIAATGVIVVPLTVIFGHEVFYENETILSQDFYDRMRNSQELPTTSQTPIGRLEELYQSLGAAGYDEILSIHLSGTLSGMVGSATGLVQDYDGIPVTVYDSQSVSAGLADQVLLASRLIKAGKTIPEVVAMLDQFRAQISANVMVDSLKHLQRTGRITGGAALIGSLMSVKPILGLEAGALVPVGKARTAKKALKQIAAAVLAKAAVIDGPVRFTVIDANNPEAVTQLLTAIQMVYPDAPIDRSMIGPAVGVHAGEGVVGVFVAPDWQTMPLD